MYLDVNQIETAVVKVVERSYSNKKVDGSIQSSPSAWHDTESQSYNEKKCCP